jgi:hypothetical protein
MQLHNIHQDRYLLEIYVEILFLHYLAKNFELHVKVPDDDLTWYLGSVPATEY